MYNHFWNWGWYNYVVGNRAEGGNGASGPGPQWSMSSNFYYLLNNYKGLGGGGAAAAAGHDDSSEFWQMTHNWNEFDDWYDGTTDTYEDTPNIHFSKYNEGDWHEILDNAANIFHTGAWMFIYVDYRFFSFQSIWCWIRLCIKNGISYNY